jgi:hypothetical protein
MARRAAAVRGLAAMESHVGLGTTIFVGLDALSNQQIFGTRRHSLGRMTQLFVDFIGIQAVDGTYWN